MFDKAWRRPFIWTGDTNRHEFLYDAQAIFKVLTGIAFVLTLILSFLDLLGALWAAGAFFVFWVLWMTALGAERLARRGIPGPVTEEQAHRAETAAEAGRDARIESAVRRSAVKFAVELFAGIVLAAVVLAVLVVEREMLGLTVLLFIACITLFGAPYWIASVHERADDERERLTHRGRR